MTAETSTSEAKAQPRRGRAAAAAASREGGGLALNVEQQLFAKALSAVTTALPRKNEIPILDTVLIEAGEASLTLTVTNLVQEASIQMPAGVRAPGRICTDARMLAGISARMKGELTVHLEGRELKIVSGRAQTGLPTLPAEDFPVFGETDGVDFEIASRALAAALGSVHHAMSSDQILYYLNGSYVEREDSSLVFTSTDGYRLATIAVTAGADADFDGAIIPRAAISDLIKLCERVDGAVTLTIGDRALEAAGAGECYRTKLIDGTFPDWRRVYPKTPGTRIVLPRKELIEAVAVAVSASREKSSSVRIECVEGRLTAATRAADGLWAKGIVEATDIPPCEPFSLNGEYLLQALEKLSHDKVKLVVIDPASPIRVETGDALRQVIMPLRV